MVSSSSALLLAHWSLLLTGSRFHPVSNTSGLVIIDGEVIDVKGNGMFVHAIQGMRPDSVSQPAFRPTDHSLHRGGTLPSSPLAASRRRASLEQSERSRWSLKLPCVETPTSATPR